MVWIRLLGEPRHLSKLFRRDVLSFGRPKGSGKTQIGLEYTYSRLYLYQTIIWILASSTEKIDQGFAQIAEQSGMEARYLKNPGEAKVLCSSDYSR